MYRLFTIDGLTNPTNVIAELESDRLPAAGLGSGVAGAFRSMAVWVGIACLLVSFVVACDPGTATPASTVDVVVEVTAASSTPTAVVPETATPPAVATLSSGIATATPESFVDVSESDVPVSSSDRPAVLRYDISSNSAIIPDPVIDFAGNGFLFNEVYSGLLRPSPTELDQVEPDLAESYRVSPDGLVYTFALREGLRFSNGSPVTSHQVKWSWERALKPDVKSERATEVLGAIKGASAIAEGEATELTGFLIIDETTFEVELEQPASHFPWLLTDPVASVMSPSNARRWAAPAVDWSQGQFMPSFLDLPVGTGPFAITQLDPFERSVVLQHNPHYWDAPPTVARAEYYIGQPTDLSDEGVDWFLGVYDVDGSSYPDLCGQSNRPGDVRINGQPARLLPSDTPPQVSYLAFNTAVAPFDDVEFRRALLASTHMGSSDQVVYVGDPGIEATGLLPQGFPGHDGSRPVSLADREAALSHLSKSSYSGTTDAYSLTLIPGGSRIGMLTFQGMTADWRDWLGLEVGFTDTPISGWLREFKRDQEAGTLQMRYVLTRPGYPSPHAILGSIPSLFGPNAQSPETEELKRMLDDAAAELDSVVRLGMYQDIEAHILDRALVLPMLWDAGGRCNRVQEWVEEFRVPKWGGSVFRNVVIDTEHPDYPDRWLETDP